MKTMSFFAWILAAVLLCTGISAFGEEEKLTITTYYPSPYGVYSTLRLYPKSEPADYQQGEIYYDQSKNRVKIFTGSGPNQKNWLLSETFNVVPVTNPGQGEKDGQVYYDQGSAQLRIWINGQWKDLISTVYVPVNVPTNYIYQTSTGTPSNGNSPSGYYVTSTGTATTAAPQLQVPGPVTITADQLELYRQALIDNQAAINSAFATSSNPVTAAGSAALLSSLNANSDAKIAQADQWIAQGGLNVASPTTSTRTTTSASSLPASSIPTSTTTSRTSSAGSLSSTASSLLSSSGSSTTAARTTTSVSIPTSSGTVTKTSTTSFF